MDGTGFLEKEWVGDTLTETTTTLVDFVTKISTLQIQSGDGRGSPL
jgi:hypothetical protein